MILIITFSLGKYFAMKFSFNVNFLFLEPGDMFLSCFSACSHMMGSRAKSLFVSQLKNSEVCEKTWGEKEQNSL